MPPFTSERQANNERRRSRPDHAPEHTRTNEKRQPGQTPWITSENCETGKIKSETNRPLRREEDNDTTSINTTEPTEPTDPTDPTAHHAEPKRMQRELGRAAMV